MGRPTTQEGVPRHVRAMRSYRRARAVAVVLVGAVALGGGLVGFTILRWRSNVTTLPSVASLVAPPSAAPGAPPVVGRAVDADDPLRGSPLNLMLLATDDRSGENAALAGADEGGGSDTALILHISADRSRVELVSLPRDSRAEIPACHLDREPDGPMSRPRTAKFNAAFAIGWATGDPALAAACTISTVQTMTGLTIHGYAIVDMAGFVGMVDAVGGVRVCVPEPLRDTRYTGLDLPAGWQDLQGVPALQYVRARHVDGGDGTDLARIERQHRFLGALVSKVLSSEVLSSPLAMGRFLDAATSSLMISEELADPGTMLGLGWSLRGLDAADLTFLTVPWAYSDGGYVTWTSDAAPIWGRLIADEPLAGGGASGDADAGGAGDADAGGAGDAGAGGRSSESAAPNAPPVAGTALRTAEDPEAAACG